VFHVPEKAIFAGLVEHMPWVSIERILEALDEGFDDDYPARSRRARGR
jgi:hypothetical protein